MSVLDAFKFRARSARNITYTVCRLCAMVTCSVDSLTLRSLRTRCTVDCQNLSQESPQCRSSRVCAAETWTHCLQSNEVASTPATDKTRTVRLTGPTYVASPRRHSKDVDVVDVRHKLSNVLGEDRALQQVWNTSDTSVDSPVYCSGNKTAACLRWSRVDASLGLLVEFIFSSY